MNAVPGPKSVFYFYITPEFTMLAFTTALETLRLANQVLGHDKYAWRIVSADGNPVRASSGLQLGVDLSLDEADLLENGKIAKRHGRTPARAAGPPHAE